jgi:hypothetical protein
MNLALRSKLSNLPAATALVDDNQATFEQAIAVAIAARPAAPHAEPDPPTPSTFVTHATRIDGAELWLQITSPDPLSLTLDNELALMKAKSDFAAFAATILPAGSTLALTIRKQS